MFHLDIWSNLLLIQVNGTSSSWSFCLFHKASLVWLLYRTNLHGKVAIIGTLCGTFFNAKHNNFDVCQTQTKRNKRITILGTFCCFINIKVTMFCVKKCSGANLCGKVTIPGTLCGLTHQYMTRGYQLIRGCQLIRQCQLCLQV